MDIQKRAAIAVSGLLLTGTAALALGVATPASAVTTPQAMSHDIDGSMIGNLQYNNQQTGKNWNGLDHYLRNWV